MTELETKIRQFEREEAFLEQLSIDQLRELNELLKSNLKPSRVTSVLFDKEDDEAALPAYESAKPDYTMIKIKDHDFECWSNKAGGGYMTRVFSKTNCWDRVHAITIYQWMRSAGLQNELFEHSNNSFTLFDRDDNVERLFKWAATTNTEKEQA